MNLRSESESLDRERVENLTAAVLKPIRDNYNCGPTSRDRALEALNALAAAAALVIRGCDDQEACDFFAVALQWHLNQRKP